MRQIYNSSNDVRALGLDSCWKVRRPRECVSANLMARKSPVRVRKSTAAPAGRGRAPGAGRESLSRALVRSLENWRNWRRTGARSFVVRRSAPGVRQFLVVTLLCKSVDDFADRCHDIHPPAQTQHPSSGHHKVASGCKPAHRIPHLDDGLDDEVDDERSEPDGTTASAVESLWSLNHRTQVARRELSAGPVVSLKASSSQP